jgi:two-component system response regulator PilR (NtrC family)
MKVLLVDDDEALRALLKEYLREKGLKVSSCKDGAEALVFLEQDKEGFEIVLTDLVLPLKGGLEVLRAARARNQETQVVIMTGYASLESAIESMREGAFDYITKPFKLVEIEIVLSKIIERRRLIEENHRLAERVQSLYSRLDMLKDNRSKLDRFITETNDKLEDNTRKINDCLNILSRISLHFEHFERPNPLLPPPPSGTVIS